MRCWPPAKTILLHVPDVGPIVARSIHRFLAEPHNREVLADLQAAGVHWPAGRQASRSTPKPWRG